MTKAQIRRYRRKMKQGKTSFRGKAPKKLPDKLVQRLAKRRYVFHQRQPGKPGRNHWHKQRRPTPFTPPKIPS